MRGFLRRKGQTWVDDPTNESDGYERVRTRKVLELLRDRGIAASSVLSRIALLRAGGDLEVARVLEESVEVDRWGLVRVSVEERWVTERVLGVVLQLAAGRAVPTDAQALAVLTAQINDGGPGARQTLGGAWVQRKGENVLVGCDPGEAQSGLEGGVWGNRFVRQEDAPSGDEPASFLVRHSLPEGGDWYPLAHERLALWIRSLRLSAGIEAREAAYQTPLERPVQT